MNLYPSQNSFRRKSKNNFAPAYRQAGELSPRRLLTGDNCNQGLVFSRPAIRPFGRGKAKNQTGFSIVSGKAGSGKTHLVLQKYSHFVEEHKEDNVIFILPTYSQVEHLRDLTLKQVQGLKFNGYLDTGLVTKDYDC